MDKKQQIKIPGYIWAIALVLVICIIYLVVVQIPFLSAKVELESEHAVDQSQIAVYQDYTDNASTYEAKIQSMKEQYAEESAVLFVNASKTKDEIYEMINSFTVTPTSISVAEGQVDSQGRTSSTGDPLYTTTVVLTMQLSSQLIYETLDYYEGNGDKSASGAYYVSTISISQVTEGEANEIVDDTYNVTLTMNLYYFDPDLTTTTTTSTTSTEESSS